MTSTISNKKISNLTLMKEDLQHRIWMIALSILGNFLASPVVFLFYQNNRGNLFAKGYYPSASPELDEAAFFSLVKKAEYFQDYLLHSEYLFPQLIVLIAGALILSVGGFSYLYSRQAADFYHSVPVTRNRYFFIVWLDGFLIWLVPFIVGQISVCTLMFLWCSPVDRGMLAALLFRQALLLVLSFLLVYHASLVAVMISGNVLNALVNLILYGILSAAFYAMFAEYMAEFYRTFYMHMNHKWVEDLFMLLSPLAAPFYLFIGSSAERLSATWGFCICFTVLFAACNLFLALFLHQNRKSELAGHGLENRFFRIVLRFLASCLAGLTLGLIFKEYANYHSFLWCLFGSLLGSLFIFMVLNVAYHASFKALLSHKGQMCCAVLFTLGFLLLLKLDPIGYDTYVPKENEIRGLTFSSSFTRDVSWQLEKTKDGYYRYRYGDPLDKKEPMFTDPQDIRRLLEVLTTQEGQPDRYGHCDNINVKVYTTHGSYCRTYTLCNDQTTWNALRPFVETDAFREYYYPASSGIIDAPDQIALRSLENDYITVTDPQMIETLYEAYRLDFTEHYSIKSAFGSYSAINVIYQYFRDADNKDSMFMVNMDVRSDYQRTIALLKKWYPNRFWEPDYNSYDAMTLVVDIDRSLLDEDTGDLTVSLYRYLGLETSEESPDPTGAKKPVIDRPATHDATEGFKATIKDREQLKRIFPYLTLSREFYSPDQEYVKIGRVILHGAEDVGILGQYYCYVKSGNVPKELLDLIHYSVD